MENYTFLPTYQKVGQMGNYEEQIIKQEKMFFSSSPEYAFANGGPIIQDFIKYFIHTRENWHDENWIIDSRVHMLMPNWFPCIPGWHHDDVPRSTPNGQPNYENPEYLSEHLMVVIGKSAMPQFLKTSILLPEIKDDIVYKVWNDLIKKYTVEEDYYTCKSGEVIQFNWNDFHRGMPSTESCWRTFIRATKNTHRKFSNEIRTQVQVYMPAIEDGW
jgi:hypothetical protein